MPILHGASVSPFVRKVRVALSEKGAAYEQKQVIPFEEQPELLSMNPLQRIPVYQDGDFKLPDSSVILQYIERIHPSPALYPSDAKEFAWALFLEELADTRLTDITLPFFFERFVKKNVLGGQPTDEARLTQIKEQQLTPTFDWLEQQVSTDGWVVGNRFSVADIALAAPFVNFQYAGEKVDAVRWPKLVAYIGRVWARPSFKAIVEDERKAFGL